MRCSITRPISTTAATSRARWPAPRRPPGRRRARSRPTTTAPSRSCGSIASRRPGTRSPWPWRSAPDDPETLEAAADLNINQLPPSADRSALGLEYARRGSRRVSHRDAERVARLALLEGQALIDLGRGAEALRRIDAALAAAPGFAAASYERGVALFELCRFAEARRMFEKVLASTPDHAHALYHLGLIEEREGDEAAAARHLAAASAGRSEVLPVRRPTSRRSTSRRASSARSRSSARTCGGTSPGSRSRPPTCPTRPI